MASNEQRRDEAVKSRYCSWPAWLPKGVHLVPVALVLCSLMAACGTDEATKVFGEQSEPCQPIELANEDEDEQKVATGTDCFMAEYEAGRSVVWDVLQVTVEGDPMPTRYEFDGSTVIITTDTTRDEFGSGGVLEQRCEGVGRTGWLPEGINCQSSDGDGFGSDSLPGGG